MTAPQQRYETIADDLVRRIRAGEFPPGGRLPSNSALCDEYATSSSVVDKALILVRVGRWYRALPGREKQVADPLPTAAAVAAMIWHTDLPTGGPPDPAEVEEG